MPRYAHILGILFNRLRLGECYNNGSVKTTDDRIKKLLD